MTTLKDLYIEELRDLMLANDLMAEVVAEMADKASDHVLADRLSSAKSGIDGHTRMLKSLLGDTGAETATERCKGMEGLADEARRKAVNADTGEAALDVTIIAQFQRMCHYGIAGFGTARAFAQALGEDAAAGKLGRALENIYDSDGFMTELTERSRNIDAIG